MKSLYLFSDLFSLDKVSRSWVKESKQSHSKDELQASSIIPNQKLTDKGCDKELRSSIKSANKSSKMISADSFLPHSTSTMSASSISNHSHSNKLPINIPNNTLNLSALTAGKPNCNESLPPPPPSYSRLPPDGHEFPPDYKDPSITGNASVFRVGTIAKTL